MGQSWVCTGRCRDLGIGDRRNLRSRLRLQQSRWGPEHRPGRLFWRHGSGQWQLCDPEPLLGQLHFQQRLIRRRRCCDLGIGNNRRGRNHLRRQQPRRHMAKHVRRNVPRHSPDQRQLCRRKSLVGRLPRLCQWPPRGRRDLGIGDKRHCRSCHSRQQPRRDPATGPSRLRWRHRPDQRRLHRQ